VDEEGMKQAAGWGSVLCVSFCALMQMGDRKEIQPIRKTRDTYPF